MCVNCLSPCVYNGADYVGVFDRIPCALAVTTPSYLHAPILNITTIVASWLLSLVTVTMGLRVNG